MSLGGPWRITPGGAAAISAYLAERAELRHGLERGRSDCPAAYGGAAPGERAHLRPGREVILTASERGRRGRGLASAATATKRTRVDAAIVRCCSAEASG